MTANPDRSLTAADRLPAPAANHLAFMAAHRGSVEITADSLALEGDEEFFSWWAPLGEAVPIPAGAKTVRVFPFSGNGWPARLEQAGFKRAGELSYLRAPAAPDGPTLPDGVTLTVVEDNGQAREFALTQAAGFAEPGDTPEQTAWWEEDFTRNALRHYASADQTFYLLRSESEGAAVALALHSHGLAGIYAVATRPAHRGRRYAGLLLAAISAEAHGRGEQLALQTEVGSTAERLYLRSGFTEDFRTPLYVRH
ncbi:GNAT family N-acetyltransferase [Streptomyces sp. NBC_00827]|uniref:GNAT family N-acetyltransferase n=1 Tax=Streptomyces sp. NBC_00827 TaxID=2903677 RepID=UPI003866B0C2|nr:GNAT family N-acetyltransferase [Streptomyces sp. NBC_00827]